MVWLLEELKVPYDIEVFKRDPATFYAPPELEKIHPLGKSPVVTVTPPGGKPIVLAESAFISNYLCEHFPEGKKLVPARWKAGQEGKVGGETEEYMRYEYFSYYTEGSFMPFLVLTMVMMSKLVHSHALSSTFLKQHRNANWRAFLHPTRREHDSQSGSVKLCSAQRQEASGVPRAAAFDILRGLPLRLEVDGGRHHDELYACGGRVAAR